MDMEMQRVFNYEGAEVRTMVIDEEVWFVGRDVAEVLGYKRPADAIRQHVMDEDKGVGHAPTSGGKQGMTIINESGLTTFILSTHLITESYRKELISALQEEGFLSGLYVKTRGEIEFIALLEQVLAPMGIVGETQYFVGSYFIDYYIPELDIAIEYDEDGHKHYPCEGEKGRQKFIEDKLGCTFIRVNDNMEHGWNVGYILDKIFNKQRK